MNPRGQTLICFALKEEASAFRKLVSGRNDVSILITGIGRKNAEKSVRDFVQGNLPRAVFTCGFAGGLDPELKVGDVVFLPVDSVLDQALVGLGAKPARFYCASRVATTTAEKAALRNATGASAVEMESECIQKICRERSIPAATVRVISDTAHEDMPLDFNLLSNADLSLNYGKLAWAVARSPWKIAPLLRLQKNCQFAAQRLAEVLKEIVELKLSRLE